MASKNEQRKIQIIADGTQVNATFNDMAGAAKLLQNQLRKLPPESEEFAKKSEQLKGVKSRMNEVKGEVFGVEKAQKELNGELMNMIPFGSEIQGIAGKFGQWTGILKNVSGGFGMLSKAIIGTGFGALVIVLGLIINYLMNTQDGIDKVTAVTRPLTAIFDRLIGVLQVLGGKLFKQLADAVKNPRQAFQDFVDFLEQNLMNRLKSVGVGFEALQMIMNGDIIDGAKRLGDAMIQAGTGVEDGMNKLGEAAKNTRDWVNDSIDYGTQLDQLHKKIEKDEIDMIRRRKELELVAKQQNFIVEDETKSYEERREAAAKALAAQEELEQMLIEHMDDKIRLKNLEHQANDTLRADDKELAEMESQRAEMAASVVEMRTTMRNKLNVVNKQEAAEHKKMLDEKAKAEDENQKRIAKLREEYAKASLEAEHAVEDLRIAVMEEGTAKKLAKLELDTQRELEAMEIKRNQLLENEALTLQERQRVIDEFNEMQRLKEEEAEAERKELEEAKREEALAEKLTKLGEEQEMEALQLEEAYINAVDKEFEQKQKLLEINREYAAQRLALLEASGKGETLEAQKLKNSILSIEKEISDGKIDHAKRTEDAKKELREVGHSSAKDMLALGLELLSEESQGRKNFVSAMKALEVGRVITDGISEVQAIWKNSNANAMNILFPGSGAIMAAVQTAAAVARTGMAVNKIRSTQYATGGGTGSGNLIDMAFNNGAWEMPGGQRTNWVGSYAKGGPINSPSFGVIGEAGAEWVSPNWMLKSPKYANIIGYLESERRKGRAFAEGGSTASTLTIPQNSGASADLQQQLQMMEQAQEQTELLREILSTVGEWPTKLRVLNDPRETRDALNVINDIEADSRISR